MPLVDQAPPLTTEQHSIIFDSLQTAVAALIERPELQAVPPDVFLVAVLSTVATLIRGAGFDERRMLLSVAMIAAAQVRS